MPSDTNNCERKLLGMKLTAIKDFGRIVLWIGGAAIAVVVFYFASEAAQERRIFDNTVKTEKTVERLADHIEYAASAFERSTRTFESLDHTMAAQHTLIRETRETLSAVNATQRELKKENGRLANSITALTAEVRKQNGTGP